jgi:hypothetical protein
MRVAVDASDTRWTAPDAPDDRRHAPGKRRSFFMLGKNAMPLVWLMAFALYFYTSVTRWQRLERDRDE